ncbi:MAG TPA: PHP-associated domain-containing protein [Methylomirabilota bacterium]|nr:PHP-associated domain-containing protein [Methylomirabilota bacterium]
MRCDLHVHSIASGMCNTPGLQRVCRESYTDPLELYAQLKQTGMSLITITDHDSIEGGEVLRRYPDFFLSEEVTCKLPSGTEAHLGVYGITERDHVEIQRRRNDFFALVMYLADRDLFFSANHIFSGLTGRRRREDFHWFASCVPAYEARNGQMAPAANAAAERLASRHGKITVGGSDAHTAAYAGRTFTEVSGARNAEEFLAGLRARRGGVRGVDGSYWKLTADIFRITCELFRERPSTLALLPVVPLMPAFTLGHWINEHLFCRFWSTVLESDRRLAGDTLRGWRSQPG